MNPMEEQPENKKVRRTPMGKLYKEVREKGLKVDGTVKGEVFEMKIMDGNKPIYEGTHEDNIPKEALKEIRRKSSLK